MAQASKSLSLAISPCPNDTFVFHAMLHGLVDTEGLEFDVRFEDIETLNRLALSGEPDVVKASVAVAHQIPYTLLGSGAALGYGNGPIVVARAGRGTEDAGSGVPNNSTEPHAPQSVALPGEHTTAALLFQRYFGAPRPTSHVPRPIYMPFYQIADAVASGAVDCGVLIHEGRFTYAEKGLWLVCDLGQKWEAETGLPIPLGAIFARTEVEKTERVIRRSVAYALKNPMASRDFVKSHAQELSQDVLEKHISYFVNDFTVALGPRGEQAIAELLKPTAPPK